MKSKQPFEAYPKLAHVIEWFASNVAVPGDKWNDLLHEINEAVRPVTTFQQMRWVKAS